MIARKKIISVFLIVLFFFSLSPVPLDAQESASFPPPTEQPDVPEPTPQPTIPVPEPTPTIPPSQETQAPISPITEQPDAPFVIDGVTMIGRFLGLGVTDPRLIIASLVRVALGFLGVIFLLMVLLAGFTLMTSGGDSERAGAAKRTFFNAVIGLIIILSANSIVMYVVRAFTGATSTQSPIITQQPAQNSDGDL